MSEKKRKLKPDTSNKVKEQHDENAWRSVLESVSINDRYWWCIVTMMVETIVDHKCCVSLFEAAAEEGKRRAIYSLSHQKTISLIKSLSKQDIDTCPVVQSVCHYANKLLNETDGALPVRLMARVIKYLVYRAKAEVVGRMRKRVELEREIDEEYRIMQTSTVVASKKLGHLGSDDPQKNKANTRLRKRDEEWRDVVSTDDAPLDGPNLYVVLTGFHDPDLPVELASVGLPLTCILRIKRSGEQTEEVASEDESYQENFVLKRKLQFFEGYDVDKFELHKFWDSVGKQLADPIGFPAYCDLAFITFCPPIIPETVDDHERRIFKKDIYDRVSYIVYDLYDLCRQHSKYLKSMKLEKYIDEGGKMVDATTYRAVLNAVPEEYLSVPIIFHAMLLQVEANVSGITVHQFSQAEGNASEQKTFEDLEFASELSMDDLVKIERKLKIRNHEYRIHDADTPDEMESERQPPVNINLILHGDTLNENIHHYDTDVKTIKFLDPTGTGLVNVTRQIFQEPRLMKFWRGHQKLPEILCDEYSRCVNQLALLLDPNTRISQEEMTHYLHILIFDQMISDQWQKKNCNRDLDKSVYSRSIEVLKNKVVSSKKLPNRSRSFPYFASGSPLYLPLANQRRAKSDANVDRNVDYISTTPEFSFLSQLTNVKRILPPQNHKEKEVERDASEQATLEEYECTELLAEQVFLQIIHECFQSYDRFVARYFEPTDSLLLLFGDDYEINDTPEKTVVSSIRTPVCLREFCEYIVAEEEDWIKREEETHRLETMELTGRLMKKTAVEYDEAMIFADEHFILPGSLKARDLGRSSDFTEQKNFFEEGYAVQESDGTKGRTTTKGRKKNAVEAEEGKRKEKNERIMVGKTFSKEKKRVTEIDDIDTSFLPPRKSLSLGCVGKDEHCEFVGYDLGRLRVQVTNRSRRFFTADGALVRVETERWLYKGTDLRIAITLPRCSVHLSETIGNGGSSSNVFHLTTEKGIVLAFSRSSIGQKKAEISAECYWQNLDFDFRASWPSGLLIEPVTGDGPNNPFYIRQSYTSKGPECIGIVHEVCRKFLRNGTVLKYMDDNTVIVLRPNGDVITCLTFEKVELREDENFMDGISLNKSEKLGKRNSRQSVSSRYRKTNTTSFKSRLIEESTAKYEGISTSDESVSSLVKTSATVKVSRYTVVNHDGRCYEVFNDLVVTEHDRLLVRSVSDYEVNEKFTRRADSTDALLNSNDELVVSFPDGTRIMTGYKIENEPVLCDWTENEIRRYFDPEKIASDGRNDVVSNGEVSRNDIWKSYDGHNESARLLIADGFVSILLTCRMEHKNYATVSYDQSAVNCTLSMPGDLQVSISRRGHYEVSPAKGVNLKIQEGSLSLSSEAHTDYGGKSTSTYNFLATPEAVRTIFTTVDAFGNLFEVTSDGTSRFHQGKSRSYGEARGMSSNETERRNNDNEDETDKLKEAEEEEEEEEEAEEEEEEEEAEEKAEEEKQQEILKEREYHAQRDSTKYQDVRSSQESRHTPNVPPKGRRYRIFAMNRNLTAYEYLHRSILGQEVGPAVPAGETSVTLYPISRRAELRRLITFAPLQPKSRSKALLQPHRIVKPWNYDRRQLLRSTYAVPYDWLLPFGKKGNGIWETTYDLPLAERVEHTVPKFLVVRVLRAFKEPGRRILKDLRGAIERYWMCVLRSGKNQPFFPASITEKNKEQSTATADDNSEEYLRRLSLGIQTSFDLETYVNSLQSKLGTASTIAACGSAELMKLLSRRATMIEEFEWYKLCALSKMIVPYFQNIPGMCFLWISDCVEKAMNIKDVVSTDEFEYPIETL